MRHLLNTLFVTTENAYLTLDGENVVVLEKEEINPVEVIRLMIGKVVDESEGSVKTFRKTGGEAALEVRDLSSRGVFDKVSFQVRRGEILGFGGLIGAGRTELVRCLYGIDGYSSGEIYLEGDLFRARLVFSLAEEEE